MDNSIDATEEIFKQAKFCYMQMGWRQNNAGRIEFFTGKVPVDDGKPLSREELREWLDSEND